MAPYAVAHYRERRVGALSWFGKRREANRPRPDELRDLRRRVLQERAGLRDRRRRFGGERIAVPPPIRLKGVFNPSPLQEARVEDHGRSSVCEKKDRADLEHGGDEIHGRSKRRNA